METTVLISLSGQQLDDLISSSLRKVLLNQAPQSSDANDDTLLDTKAAAKFINYKETSVYGLVKRKKIPFIKVEGKLLFSKKRLLEWIEKGGQPNL